MPLSVRFYPLHVLFKGAGHGVGVGEHELKDSGEQEEQAEDGEPSACRHAARLQRGPRKRPSDSTRDSSCLCRGFVLRRRCLLQRGVRSRRRAFVDFAGRARVATAVFVRGEAEKDEGEEDGARREKDVVDGVAPRAKGAVGTGAVGGYGGDGSSCAQRRV